MRSLPSLVFCLCVLTALFSQAAPDALTISGRILNPDGTPLSFSAVTFMFTITSADGTCTIYREQSSSIDMTNSDGVFDLALGSGTRSYPPSPIGMKDIFSNSSTLSCSGGATYTPLATDSRHVEISFYDGTGWQSFSPDLVVSSVPYSLQASNADALSSHSAADFILKNDVNGNTSCDSGNFLTWDATTKIFGCSAVSGASGGTVTNVSSTNSYLSVVSGTSAPALTVNVGSTSGTLAAGDDARLANALQTGANAGGDLSGTYPNPNVVKIQNTGVTFTSLTSGEYFKYNGTDWVNSAISTSDVTGLSTTLSSVVMQNQLPASCAANQTLTFLSPSSSFTCSLITISGSQVSGDIGGNAGGFNGNLGGDVIGTQTGTQVVGLQGRAISTSLPINGQFLAWNGSVSKWEPTTPAPSPWNINGSNINYTTGKVGIGISNPNQALDVQGNINSSGGYYFNGTRVLKAPSSNLVLGNTSALNSGTGDYNVVLGSMAGSSLTSGDSNIFMGQYAGAALTNGSNNIFLGESAASNAVSGTGNIVIGSTTFPSLYSGTDNIIIGNGLDLADGSNSLRIGSWITGDSFGKIGINLGNNSPLASFHIHTTGSSNAFLLESTNTGDAVNAVFRKVSDQGQIGFVPSGSDFIVGSMSAVPLIFKTSNTEHMRIDTSGKIGIGTSTPAYALDVAGDIQTSTCIRTSAGVSAGTCLSDARLKTDIHPFTLGLEALLALNPKYFKYNGLGGHPVSQQDELGVIAQDVEKGAPELILNKQVKLHPDDHTTTEVKQVNYTALTYVLINAVKELYHSLTNQNQQLASLQQENLELKNAMLQMQAALCAKDLSYSFCQK